MISTEEPLSLGEIDLSIFSDAYSTVPKETTLLQVLHSIRDYENPIIRKIRSTSNPEELKSLKNKLPRFAVNYTFEGGRKELNKQGKTSILEIELDAKDNKEFNLVEWGRENSPKMPGLITSFRTASGKGFAFIFRIDPNDFENSYYTLKHEFEKLGFTIDRATRSTTYLRSISYDPDIYINPNAGTFESYLKAPRVEYRNTEADINDPQFKACIDYIQEHQIDITGDYAQWKDIAFAIANAFGEDGEAYFDIISQYSDQYHQFRTRRQYKACLKAHTTGDKIGIGTFYFYCKKYFELPAVTPPVTESDEAIKVDRYISDKIGLVISRLLEKKNLVLKSPTGSGKTTAIRSILSHLKGSDDPEAPDKILFLVPLVMIADDFHKAFKGIPNVAVVKGWDSGTSKDEIQADLNAAAAADLIVCTYDSYFKVKALLARQKVLFVGDEADYPTKNRRWKGISDKEEVSYDLAYNDVLNAEYSLLLSATPPNLYTLKQIGFYILEFKPSQGISHPYQQIRYKKGKLEHVFISWLAQQDLTKGRILVRFNGNEDRVNTIMEHVQGLFGLSSDQQGYLRSKYRHKKDYKYIIENNTLPPGQLITYTTSLMDCGFNLLDEDVQAIVIMDDARQRTTTTDVVQFAARERLADGVPVVHFVGKHKEKKPMLSYEMLMEHAKGFAEDANRLQRWSSEPIEFNLRNHTDELEAIIWSPEQGKYIPNISKIIGDLDQQRESSLSHDEFEKILVENYNFTAVKATETEAVKDPLLDAALAATKVTKEEKKKTFQQLLAENPEQVLEAYYYAHAHHRHNTIVKRIKKSRHYMGSIPPPTVAEFYNKHADLFKEGSSAIKRWLEVEELGLQPSLVTLELSTRHYGDIKRRINALIDLENKEKLRSAKARAFQNYIQDLVNALTPFLYMRVKDAELVEVVNQVRAKHRHRPLNFADSKKLIRNYFDLAKRERFYIVRGRFSYQDLATQLIEEDIINSINPVVPTGDPAPPQVRANREQEEAVPEFQDASSPF